MNTSAQSAFVRSENTSILTTGLLGAVMDVDVEKPYHWSCRMTDQEQAPLNLAEGARLLAAYKHPASTGFDTIRWQDWLIENGAALVAALKAITNERDMWRSRYNDATKERI